MLFIEQINPRLVLERTSPRERGYGQTRASAPARLPGSSSRRGQLAPPSWIWRGHGLTELPEAIGQLSQLQTLDLSDNQLSALPEAIGQLSQLQSLDLSATS